MSETREAKVVSATNEESKGEERKRKAPAVGTRKSTRARTKVETYDLDVLIPKMGANSSTSFSPMLASKYDGTQDIKGWIMSEKLDGLR